MRCQGGIAAGPLLIKWQAAPGSNIIPAHPIGTGGVAWIEPAESARPSHSPQPESGRADAAPMLALIPAYSAPDVACYARLPPSTVRASPCPHAQAGFQVIIHIAYSESGHEHSPCIQCMQTTRQQQAQHRRCDASIARFGLRPTPLPQPSRRAGRIPARRRPGPAARAGHALKRRHHGVPALIQAPMVARSASVMPVIFAYGMIFELTA